MAKFGEIMLWVIIMSVITASIIVPMSVYATSNYYCICELSEIQLLEVYEKQGDEIRVWLVDIYKMNEFNLVKLHARANGGLKDINNLFNKVIYHTKS